MVIWLRTGRRMFVAVSTLAALSLKGWIPSAGLVQLKPSSDFTTVETLGNTGSVALPITMARGVESGHLQKDDRVAMLGIGSGINSVMLAVDWQNSWLKTAAGEHAPHFHSRLSTLDS